VWPTASGRPLTWQAQQQYDHLQHFLHRAPHLQPLVVLLLLLLLCLLLLCLLLLLLLLLLLHCCLPVPSFSPASGPLLLLSADLSITWQLRWLALLLTLLTLQ